MFFTHGPLALYLCKVLYNIVSKPETLHTLGYQIFTSYSHLKVGPVLPWPLRHKAAKLLVPSFVPPPGLLMGGIVSAKGRGGERVTTTRNSQKPSQNISQHILLQFFLLISWGTTTIKTRQNSSLVIVKNDLHQLQNILHEYQTQFSTHSWVSDECIFTPSLFDFHWYKQYWGVIQETTAFLLLSSNCSILQLSQD